MSNSRAKHDHALLLDIVAAPVRLPSKAEMHVISGSLIDTKHRERSLEPTVDICGPRLAPLPASCLPSGELVLPLAFQVVGLLIACGDGGFPILSAKCSKNGHNAELPQSFYQRNLSSYHILS